jgi:AcrR family transcriptional regulator
LARRRLTLELDPIVQAVADGELEDDVATAILDATEELLVAHGLHRWSVEDVAERCGLGRTTVYRRFPSRDDLVHGVLARELRRAIAAVGAAAAGQVTIDGAVVEAALAALRALDRSIVDRLLQTDPATVLPLLTTEAGPLIVQARRAFVPALLAIGVARTEDQAAVVAEALARLGLSFVLTRDTALPLHDPEALREAVAALVLPLTTDWGPSASPR